MNLTYRSPELAAHIRELLQQAAVALDPDEADEQRVYRFIRQTDGYLAEQLAFEDRLALNLQSESMYALPHDAKTEETSSSSPHIGDPPGHRGGDLGRSGPPFANNAHQSANPGVNQ